MASESLEYHLMSHRRKIAVIGLGYVGLPVAASFARAGSPVVGFDIDQTRILELKAGQDRTREVEASDLKLASLSFTSETAAVKASDFFIVTVPTPIDGARRPDLGAMFEASRMVGASLKKGDIVVYESTVNPGDRRHRFESIVKVVSAQNPETLDVVAKVYGSVVTAGIHRAPSIKVAEAAKVIENTQRDLNIAFMNELSLIFQALNIDTGDVLAAAQTKWNFMPFQPGLVGGHCIGVDPYYLTFRAEKAGYHPEVILAGRRINDGMGERIARECIRGMLRRKGRGGIVTILGLTFKEDVPDTRNSRVVDVIRELESYGLTVQVHDPMANAADAMHEYGVTLTDLDALQPADAVILAVAHDHYIKGDWPLIQKLLLGGEGLVLDVKMKLDRGSQPVGIELWRL